MPLAYYSRAATEEFWSEHWAGQDLGGLLEVARASPLTDLVEKALPRHGVILEAGCGLGQYVVLLRQRGRRLVGVDWSLDALGRCRAAAPSTPLALANLATLPIRTGSLAGYLSLGVVEHDPSGPAALVAEAARVLAPGGRLVLSVPYWNGMRRLLAPHLVRQARRLQASGGEFYQFAFSRREVERFLVPHGFRVLSFHPYDPARMLRTIVRAVRRPRRSSAGRSPRASAAATAHADGTAHAIESALRRLLYTELPLRLLGHMLLTVAVRT